MECALKCHFPGVGGLQLRDFFVADFLPGIQPACDKAVESKSKFTVQENIDPLAVLFLKGEGSDLMKHP